MQAMARSLRAVAGFGLLLAILLAGFLAVILWHDRSNRLDAAQRQSQALVTGVDRLLQSELATVERALEGIASDGRRLFERVPADAAPLLQASIDDVLSRNLVLHSVELVNDSGQPLEFGAGDLSMPVWTRVSMPAGGTQLQVGPLQVADGGEPLLRLAMPMEPGRWLLARLRLGEAQDAVVGLDAGRRGVVAIATAHGELVAHSQDPARWVGHRVDTPLDAAVLLPPDDGEYRIAAVSAPARFPLQAYVGLARSDVLAPWWPLMYSAIALYLMYWFGFGYLLWSMRGNLAEQRRLGEELRTGAAELALAHRVGRVGTWWMDAEGGLHWSRSSQRIFGLPQRSARRDDVLARVHVDDRAMLASMLDETWAGRGPMSVMFRLFGAGGTMRWLSARGELVQAPGTAPRLTGALVDVSERIEGEARIEAAERQFRLVFDRSPIPMWLFDLQTLHFLEVNHAAVEQYGYSRDEFLSMSILDIRPPDAWSEVHESLTMAREGHVRDAVVRTHRRKDGSLLEVRGHVAGIEFGGVQACMVLAEDVSKSMAYERELAYRASHNAETGLLTVRALAETLDFRGGACTVAYLQLRGLRMIGDTLGREAGDRVLHALVARLGGLGARWGLLAYEPGEDFVLALSGDQGPQRALEALQEVVGEPVRTPDSWHQLEARIGVATGAAGEQAEQVIGRAAQAAHAAHEDRVPVCWFEQGIADRLSERLRLAGRIHQAIEREEFVLHFQPIQHADDGSVAALEALLRWPQPDGSWIGPDQFIQLCEDTGLIIALGRWLIRAAAAAQRQLVMAGFGHVPVAVNVSAVQFFGSDLAGDFVRAIEEFGLERGALQVELTESSLMHKPAQALQAMRLLHDKGISVSLDDFGTGFSSMSYLQHLPLDTLKIDRGFVNDVEFNPRNAAICRALLSLGHSMGLKVIAEGVETPGQQAWLAAHGCDQLQGYLLGRPAPLGDVLRALCETAVEPVDHP